MTRESELIGDMPVGRPSIAFLLRLGAGHLRAPRLRVGSWSLSPRVHVRLLVCLALSGLP